MKKFPVTIVDNFYDDPDFVRNFALSLEYSTDGDGKWPGTRSPFLDLVDEKFFSMFNAKLLSLFFDLEKTEVECSIETSFQKINPFSADKDDIKNSGWVHSDETLFSGVIYLNPDYHLYSGTSVYKFKPGTDKKLIQNTKHLHYSGSDKFNDEEHEIEKRFNNDKFIETIRVENIYNRLVLFEQNIPHGVPTYYTEANEPRLTQVFFVNSLTSTTMFPLIRKRLVSG